MIIGICGPKGTGKDTTARRLIGAIRNGGGPTCANITWFADPLYHMVSLLTLVPVEQLRDQSYKEVIWTAETAPIPTLVGSCPRELLKDLGMWVRDEVHADHWAQHLFGRTAKFPGWWLVPDLRFVNEAKVCDVRIEVRREGIDYAGDHPSERRLPEELIDYTVVLTPDMDYGALAERIMALVPKS